MGGGDPTYTLEVLEVDGAGEDVIEAVDVSDNEDGTLWFLVVDLARTLAASRTYNKSIDLVAHDSNRSYSTGSISFTFQYLPVPVPTVALHADTQYQVAEGEDAQQPGAVRPELEGGQVLILPAEADGPVPLKSSPWPASPDSSKSATP